jgi:hypothetical protein
MQQIKMDRYVVVRISMILRSRRLGQDMHHDTGLSDHIYSFKMEDDVKENLEDLRQGWTLRWRRNRIETKAV